MELEDFDDDEIVAEAKRRKLEDEFESDFVDECDIGDFGSDELMDELRSRGFKIQDDEDFLDLELTSMFADGIREKAAEIIQKFGEQKLHHILERFLTVKINIKQSK